MKAWRFMLLLLVTGPAFPKGLPTSPAFPKGLPTNHAFPKGIPTSPVFPKAPLTLEQAKRLDAGTPGSKNFPLVVNRAVVTEVNRLTGSPNQRRSFREVVQRLESYRDMIEEKLARHRLPLELLAVPVVESGYRNLPEDEAPQGAGLWMIVKRTARQYGLKIGSLADERLNEEKATEAAAKYLAHLYQTFHSWPLALAAYNRGETDIRERIAANGTRDAWKLDDEGPVVGPYLTKTMAAAFILKHPKLLD